jgi:hypothetical protein
MREKSEDCVVERRALEDLLKLCVKMPEIRQSKAFEAVEQQGEIWCPCDGAECVCGLNP